MAGKRSQKSTKVTRMAEAEAAKPSKAVAKSLDHMNASKRIDKIIADLGDWRGERLAEIRELIREADPDVIEEMKWDKPSNSMQGVPVWSHDGIICTGETYKDKVKFTFAKGASLEDPAALFNASLEGKVRRVIDLYEGDEIDKTALKALLRRAVARNTRHAVSKRKGPRA